MTNFPFNPLRSRARDAGIRTLHASGSLQRAREKIAQRRDIVVLTLHRIVPDATCGTCRSPVGMVLRESLLQELLHYLGENATFVSPDEVDTDYSVTLDDKSRRPRILLTFDDGWLDNWTTALSLLEKVRAHVCFFVATALLGTQCPFWPERMLGLLAFARRNNLIPIVIRSLHKLRTKTSQPLPASTVLHAEEPVLRWLKQFSAPDLFCWIDETLHVVHAEALKRSADLTHAPMLSMPTDPTERLMTWDHLRMLVERGHRIGSHTCTHPILPQIDESSMKDEIRSSRDELLKHLPQQNGKPLWISYPNGSSSPSVLQASRDAGYQYGFSNSTGVWGSTSDPFLLPRVNVWDGTLLDSNGHFSEKHLDYSLFWRTNRAISGR